MNTNIEELFEAIRAAFDAEMTAAHTSLYNARTELDEVRGALECLQRQHRDVVENGLREIDVLKAEIERLREKLAYLNIGILTRD